MTIPPSWLVVAAYVAGRHDYPQPFTARTQGVPVSDKPDPYRCEVCSEFAGKPVWHVVPSLAAYHLAAYTAPD